MFLLVFPLISVLIVVSIVIMFVLMINGVFIATVLVVVVVVVSVHISSVSWHEPTTAFSWVIIVSPAVGTAPPVERDEATISFGKSSYIKDCRAKRTSLPFMHTTPML